MGKIDAVQKYSIMIYFDFLIFDMYLTDVLELVEGRGFKEYSILQSHINLSRFIKDKVHKKLYKDF